MDTDVFVAEHPQATMAQIAVGLSRSGAICRMQDVCAKGLTANSGTYRHPFWEVPGVEHSPEELLTERYTARRDLQRLEVRGLVAKGEDGRWRATVI
jgi:hypothetical protein